MRPEPVIPAEEPAAPGKVGEKSIAWQLVQVAILLTLLGVGMYEVDLDAKTLAEKRGRTALMAAVGDAARRLPATSPDPELERAFGAYAKVCAECAPVDACESVIRLIRAGNGPPSGRGPCKEGIFERWSADETARSPRTP